METVLVRKKDIEIRSFTSLPDPARFAGAPNYRSIDWNEPPAVSIFHAIGELCRNG
jgi:hypothetical protein